MVRSSSGLRCPLDKRRFPTARMSTPGGRQALRKVVGYLPKLTMFALRRFAAARWAVGLALFGVAIEYLTLTIMLPLEFSGAFVRLIQDAHDELQALMTAPRS